MMNNVNLNTSSYFIRYLVKVEKALARNIVIGGLITPIIVTLDYEVCRLEEVTGRSRIDLEAYVAMKIIIRDDDCYCLVLRN